MKEKIALFVVSHKEINVKNYPGRKILYVGTNNLVADNKTVFKDNTGDNISKLNPFYCELTALYWIWKNYNDAEYVGIEHYRRCFYKNLFKISSTERLYKRVRKVDFLHFQTFYHIFSEKWRFGHYQGKGLHRVLRNAISVVAPEYLNQFDHQMKSWYCTYCNIFICKKELFDQYMEFMFKVLFEAEKHLDELTDEERKRCLGYMAERVFDTFLNYHHYKHRSNLVRFTSRWKLDK